MKNIVLLITGIVVLPVNGFLESIHFSERVVISDTPNQGPVVRRVIENVSVERCVLECRTRLFCDYINYYRPAYLCYIVQITSGTEATIIRDPGYVFANRAEFTEPNVFECNTCSYQEACNIDTALCVIKECDIPEQKDFAKVQGNTFTVNQKIKYICDPGYTMERHTTNIATCSSDGLWSKTNFTCAVVCDNEWRRYNDSCFLLMAEKRSYFEAQTECSSKHNGGHLADIISAGVQEFIIAYYQSLYDSTDISGIWIAANDLVEEGTFRWSDGSLVTYSNWDPGQPDGYAPDDHCTELWTEKNLRWNDVACDIIFWYMCEYKL